MQEDAEFKDPNDDVETRKNERTVARKRNDRMKRTKSDKTDCGESMGMTRDAGDVLLNVVHCYRLGRAVRADNIQQTAVCISCRGNWVLIEDFTFFVFVVVHELVLMVTL